MLVLNVLGVSITSIFFVGVSSDINITLAGLAGSACMLGGAAAAAAAAEIPAEMNSLLRNKKSKGYVFR